jgi:hypothetical protein
MRKTQMALAAVALVASSAALAEVTVSGRIDAGVQSGSSAAFSRQLTGGLLAPNFLNFAGSEDLGGGTKALWTYSTTFSSTGYGGITNLQSYVGLSGDFGTLKVGQQLDALGLGVLGFDVTSGGNMGSTATMMFMHGSSGIFHENTIGYSAPTIGGVNISGSYVVNNGAGARSTTALKQGDYSLFGSADVGMAKLGVGYSELNQNKSWVVAAGSDLGFANVNILYMDSTRAAGIANAKGSTTGVNAKVPLVGALAATGGYYSTNGSAINGSNTSIGLLYSLSKQTTVFGNYEKATGKTLLGFGASGTGQGTSGEIYTVGIAHSF